MFSLRISGFRLQNFGPFLDSGLVELDEGVTFVVGANNSGKSFVLRGLWMREALPYVSAQRTNTPLPPTLTLRMRTTTREALALLEVEGGLWIPHSSSSQMAALQAFRAHLQDRASFELEAHLPNGSLAQPPRYAHPPYESDQSWMWAHTSGNHRPQAAHDAFQLLQNESQRVRESIFYFDARRTDFARCVDSGAVDIGSNGSNLATALAQRQQNQPKYKAYLSLVQRVIPDLEWISAETSNNEARLLSWLEPPGERSGEQRMSISECGAGVGHVLAMIYVAFYERNRTLLIDEPQAYLHPKACRELIRVFQDLRQHGHQFVIATHSTAMLSEAMPANVIEVHRQKQCSVLRSTSAKTMRDACAVLPLVGARWSDVFGPDRLVWVEGETEAACYPLLLQGLRSQHATTFVPLHATADIAASKKSDKAKLAFDIYTKVTSHMSLTAQRCLILLDRESLSEEERDKISARLPRGVVEFAPHRMFEELLLDATAIAKRLARLVDGLDPAASEQHVRALLDAKSPDESPAGVLERIYSSVSGGCAEYRKVEEGVALTQLTLESSPERFRALVEWLIRKLGLDPSQATSP